MSLISQTLSIPERLRGYVNEFKNLFKKYNITSLTELVKQVKNSEFRKEWINIWEKIVSSEGGKLSLATIGAIIGSSIGGVGIATMGSAIGIHLAPVLGLAGYVAGSEADENNILNRIMNIFKKKDKLDKKPELKTEDLYALINGIEESLGQYSAHIIDLESNMHNLSEKVNKIDQLMETTLKQQQKLKIVIIVSILLSVAAILISIFAH